MKKCKPWNVAIGVTLNGQIIHDFESGPHALIGGATDMGKSNILERYYRYACFIISRKTLSLR
jgi:hypothetical protein